MNEDHIKQYGLRVAEAVRDECGDLAHKYVSAGQFIRSAMNLQAIVDGVPTPRELSRARVADAAKTVMNKITIPTADVTERLAMLGDAIAGHPRDFMPDEHAAPPVPRDVLVKALDDMMYHCACQWSNSDPDKMVELCRDDIERIADCYASKVQPEPTCQHRIADARNPVVASGYLCVDCGALFSAVDHGVQKQPNPEPVNQQLLVALKGMVGYCRAAPSNTDAIVDARAAIAAAEAAQHMPISQSSLEAFNGDMDVAIGHAAICEEIDAEAAQPVVMHAGKFFTWDDETGFDLFDTKEEAKKAAQESIDLYRDLADCDGWPEAVENVCWGVVLGKTLEVELPAEGNPHVQLLSRNHYVDYVLTDAQQPASAQPAAVPDGARKVFICDVCEGVYADEPVTNCDCTVSEKTTFREGYIVMLSAAQKPEGV